LRVGERDLDLGSRVLVAGVVPPPRFGREAEVAAAVGALASLGADVADVSLPRPLAGAAVRAARLPVAMRATTPDELATALAVGAQIVMVPPAMADDAAATKPAAAVVSVLVGDLAALERARAEAELHGLPLAFDSTAATGAAAIAAESAAVAGGCRLLRTADVRRSRRVAEVMTALLAGRRPDVADQLRQSVDTRGVRAEEGPA
jgi:hypothetical protein